MKTGGVVFLALMLSAVVWCGEDVHLSGGGAGYPAPLYLKWIEFYKVAHPQVKIDFESGNAGSGFGKRSRDFLATYAPLPDGVLKKLPGEVLHIPIVAEPLALIFNLPGVTELRLNGDALVAIYSGTIVKWNDAKLIALNPGIVLPDKPIALLSRADGCAANWMLSHYLSVVSAEWKTSVGAGVAVNWPSGALVKEGGDNLEAIVAKTDGGLGAVELANAASSGLPMAKLINQAGKAVKPAIEGIEAAEKQVQLTADLRLALTNMAGDESYPIGGFNYFIVYRDLSYMKNKEKATEFVNFLAWCITEGQKTTRPIFAPLSPELIKAIEARLKAIEFEGQPVLK